MTNIPENPTITPENVWATLREIALLQKESERERKESELERKEAERERKEAAADSDRRMKKIEEAMGSWANNHGAFAEEYFFNSFEIGETEVINDTHLKVF